MFHITVQSKERKDIKNLGTKHHRVGVGWHTQSALKRNKY